MNIEKRMPSRLLALIATMLFVVAGAWEAQCRSLVYRLHINDEIGSSTWQHTRRALEEATARNADIFLLHLNTYGGEVGAADSMRTALLHAQMPVVAFVDNNAASAGALIALACDSVFMRPDASMGAATVVSGADGTAMPDKYQSYMRAIMRATAESHGKVPGPDSTMVWRRNPLIAEAMVDIRVTVPGLIDSTRVLTLTADEAVRWHYAEGKAETIDDVLASLGITDYDIATFRPSWVDYLMGFLTNPAVQGMLIMVIVAGIYFELQSPGMGFPSMAAIIAALLYFMPMYLTGIVDSWVVIVFFAGAVLLCLEVFVIPGFGVAGITGIAAMIVAVIAGLLENFALPTGGEIDLGVIWRAMLTFCCALALAVGAIALLMSKYGARLVGRRTELTHQQRVADGYIGVDTAPSRLVGREGVAATALHPSGKVEVDGEHYDAVALGGFIEAGSRVRITKFENAQLYVRGD